jgi:outer membrane lipoprotein-sorting protein
MQKMQMTTIARGDKKALWILQPGRKTYMEIDLRSSPQGADLRKSLQIDQIVQTLGGRNAVTQKSLGKEMANGYLCDKYLISPKVKTPGRSAMTFWVSKKLGMPLRVKSQGSPGMTMDFKNIREGKVADSLFEIPKGYKKTAMPAMPGGMGRGPGMGGSRRPMTR